VSYELVDHTADLAVRVRGRDLAHLAAELARATIDQLASVAEVGRTTTVPVTIEAPDREALLVALANELIYRRDAEGLLLPWLELHALDETRLVGELSGEPAAERHAPRAGLKAATYHELAVIDSADGFLELFLVFDV
jgi:SHS2 domain-containing protein